MDAGVVAEISREAVYVLIAVSAPVLISSLREIVPLPELARFDLVLIKEFKSAAVDK